MKNSPFRFVRILALCAAAFLLSAPAWAQKGLHVEPLFDGSYEKNPKAVTVDVRGKRLKPYDLTLFRSITVHGSPHDADRMAAAALADGQGAVNSEVVKRGKALVAGYYQLLPRDRKGQGPNRFVLFRRLEEGAATLIYLEGETELEKLIRLFVKPKK